MAKRILALIDPAWSGHSPAYFALYWKVMAEHSRLASPALELVGFSPQPEQTQEMLRSHGFQNSAVLPLVTPQRSSYGNSIFGDSQFAIAHWKALARALSRCQNNRTDTIALALILLLEPFIARCVSGPLVNRMFPWPWAALYLHPVHFRIKQSKRLRLLDRLIPVDGAVRAARCRAVLTLDEVIAPAMSRAIKKPVLAVPDVADPVSPQSDLGFAHLISAKAKGRLVCGLIGSLQKRKGILDFIEVAKSKPSGWFFVLAGTIAERDFSSVEKRTIKEFVDSQSENCAFWLQHIPDGSCFNAVVSACDVLYALYQWFPHSSNILTKAALFRKPVIVSDRFLMGERVKEYGLGWLLPEAGAPVVTDLLSRLDQKAVRSKEAAARFGDYASIHSESRLYSTLNQILPS